MQLRNTVDHMVCSAPSPERLVFQPEPRAMETVLAPAACRMVLQLQNCLLYLFGHNNLSLVIIELLTDESVNVIHCCCAGSSHTLSHTVTRAWSGR